MITNSWIGSYGRLGNQMFQLAFLVAQARRLGTRAFVNVEQPGFLLGPYLSAGLVDVLPARSYAARYAAEVDGVFEERGWNWSEETMQGPDRVDYRGYFQSERYFTNVAAEVRRCFGSPAIDSDTRATASFLCDRTLVQVRSGDSYAAHPQFHVNLHNTDYHQRALSTLTERFDGLEPKVAVTTDEFHRWRGRLPFYAVDVVYLADIGDPVSDLWLASQCEHYVIANSSFGWWAAWLRVSPEQQVIAPAAWFGCEGPHPYDGVYCQDWTVL